MQKVKKGDKCKNKWWYKTSDVKLLQRLFILKTLEKFKWKYVVKINVLFTL